jgi:hypothetical protein
MKTKLVAVLSLFSSCISGILVFTGCATVDETVRTVVADPNVQAAAQTLGNVAVTAAVMSKPELAAVITSGVAAVGAITALVKAFKKVK